jgi:hypothetical protein
MFKLLISLLLFLAPAIAHESFKYDLNLTSIPGKSPGVMIVAHGMGGCHQIAKNVKTDKTIVSFNFPDYNCFKRQVKIENSVFGTVEQILPLLYVIKNTVVVDGKPEVDLYGFSAGGGAIVDAIAALNTSRFDENLKQIGIDQSDKEKMLAAIQKGTVILDCPLKSIGEIAAFRPSPDLEYLQKRYKANALEPIDSLNNLKGLSLHVILYFNNPDEVISNRDDQLFYQRLKKANEKGTTLLIIGQGGGHNTPHPLIWEAVTKYTENDSKVGR